MTTRNSFGEGSPPAIHGEFMIVNWNHEGASLIVALNKRTGAELWRRSRDEPTSWSTPLIVDIAGKAQVIVSTTNKTRSYDLATGATIWECAGLGTNVIPTPVYRRRWGPHRHRCSSLVDRREHALCRLAPALRGPTLHD